MELYSNPFLLSLVFKLVLNVIWVSTLIVMYMNIVLWVFRHKH